MKADARPDNRQRAGEIWCAAGNPRGTIVEQYLASRSLELADNIACSVIRFHAACPWRDETGKPARVPAMISLFRTINSDEPVAIQRTALTAAGKKLGRLSLGPVGHAAIKIDPDENVTAGLHIGEGFETCLAARMLGLRPVWALGSASAIAAFPLLSGIDCLSVLAETDDHGANAAAIEKAGTRWVAAGREVTILEPKIGGDANDALRSIMQ